MGRRGHGKESLERVERLGWGTRLVCEMQLLTGGTQMVLVNHGGKV